MANQAADVRPLLHDSAFAPVSQRTDAHDLFALSPQMQAYVEQHLQPQLRRAGLQHGLMAALQRDGQLRLEYDSHITRTAREAFEDRAGNCLSLVVMTAAFARALGLQVQYHAVAEAAGWERDGRLVMEVGHVNLSLHAEPSPMQRDLGGLVGVGSAARGSRSDGLTIDFLPDQDLGQQRRQDITEVRVVSMYQNNKAVEALQLGQEHLAYAWARGSVLRDPGHTAAYNTLGVVYLRRSLWAAADATLAAALTLEPDHTPSLANRVTALRGLGQTALADHLHKRLVELESGQAHALHARGLDALERGEWRLAQALFRQALRRSPDHHELHLGLARAAALAGDRAAALGHLQAALANSPSRQRSTQYLGKLERLRATRPNTLPPQPPS